MFEPQTPLEGVGGLARGRGGSAAAPESPTPPPPSLAWACRRAGASLASGIQPGSFLGLLLAARNRGTGEKLTDLQICASVEDFLAAGEDWVGGAWGKGGSQEVGGCLSGVGEGASWGGWPIRVPWPLDGAGIIVHARHKQPPGPARPAGYETTSNAMACAVHALANDKQVGGRRAGWAPACRAGGAGCDPAVIRRLGDCPPCATGAGTHSARWGGQRGWHIGASRGPD